MRACVLACLAGSLPRDADDNPLGKVYDHALRPFQPPANVTLAGTGTSTGSLPAVNIPLHLITPAGHTVLSSQLPAPVELRTKGFPDSQADICVVPDESYLSSTTAMGPFPINTASKNVAIATRVGRIRYAIVDDQGHSAIAESTAFVVPTQPEPIFGTNTMHDNVFFNMHRGKGEFEVGGASVPVTFNGRYSFDVVFNPSFSPTTAPSTADQCSSPTVEPEQCVPVDKVSDALLLDGRAPRIAEFFGNMGSASLALTTADTVAYFDSSSKAHVGFADAFPGVPQFGDIKVIAKHPHSFLHESAKADVVFVGSACHSHGNQQDNRQCIDALQLFIQTNAKVGVFEFDTTFASTDFGRLFNEFCDSSQGYTVSPHIVNARKFGGAQTRTRLFITLVRADVADALGPMPPPTESGGGKDLVDCLEPVEDLDLNSLIDNRRWLKSKRVYNDDYTGAKSDFYIDDPGDLSVHNTAYSIFGPAPELTNTPTVIYDNRVGVFRRLSAREYMRVAGLEENFEFPHVFSDDDVYSAVSTAFDQHAIKAVGESVFSYLQGKTPDHQCWIVSSFEHHRRLGCPPGEVMRKMGYPNYQGDCPYCPLGKSRRAMNSKTCVPHASAPPERVYMDQKISSVPDKNGVTRCLGLVDSHTNMSWCIPLSDGTTATVIKALDSWRVHELKNKQVGTLVMDNDPAFTSKAMHEYLTKINVAKQFSCAYHQHQNGPAEHLWARLSPTAKIHVHSAPWLGVEYWTWAMRWAKIGRAHV